MNLKCNSILGSKWITESDIYMRFDTYVKTQKSNTITKASHEREAQFCKKSKLIAKRDQAIFSDKKILFRWA